MQAPAATRGKRRAVTRARSRRRAVAAREPRADRRRLKPDERRAQLLEAAMQVFARRGLGRGTHADVAEACGVVVGTVFLYFPTREALLAEVLAEVERESTAIAERCHVGKSAPESLRLHVRECLDLVERKPEYALIWLDWSTAVRDDVWPRYLAFQDRIVTMIAASIERGRRAGKVPTKELATTCARLIVSSTQMLAQMHFTQQPRKSIEMFADAVVDIALGLPHGPR